MKKETKANKNKIWEIIPRRKGKLRKLLFVDGISPINSWSFVLANSSRGARGAKYGNAQIHTKLSVIEFRQQLMLRRKQAAILSRDSLGIQLKSSVNVCEQQQTTLALIAYGKLSDLWQILWDFSDL
jgi:hypothetical protein